MDLFDCCIQGNLEEFQRLIAKGTLTGGLSLTDVNKKCNNGLFPLHFASGNGHLAIVKELIKHQAHINETDLSENTPLHSASWYGYIAIVKELIKHQAHLNKQNVHKCTPLHFAVIRNHLDIVRELIFNKAVIDIKDNKGNTPLHEASIQGHLEIVKELIDYSDLSIKNNKEQTVLDLARTEEIKQFIIDYQNLPEIKEPDIN